MLKIIYSFAFPLLSRLYPRQVVHELLSRVLLRELQPIHLVVLRLPKVAQHAASPLVFQYEL